MIIQQGVKEDKVFKSGPIKIYGRQSLKVLKGYGQLKGCLSQILLGPLLNTLSQYFSEIIYFFLDQKLNFRTLAVKVLEMLILRSNNNPVEL